MVIILDGLSKILTKFFLKKKIYLAKLKSPIGNFGAPKVHLPPTFFFDKSTPNWPPCDSKKNIQKLEWHFFSLLNKVEKCEKNLKNAVFPDITWYYTCLWHLEPHDGLGSTNWYPTESDFTLGSTTHVHNAALQLQIHSKDQF